MVTISIITPFYNGNAYIGRICEVFYKNRESLMNVYADAALELIIVNDSPDVTPLIPADVSDKDIRVFTHEINKGVHQSRITGLSVCKGDYILFLDQDDIIASDFIVRQYSYIKDADVSVSLALMEEPDGIKRNVYNTRGKIKKITTIDTYLKSHNQIVSPGQCLINKKAIPQEWIENIMDNNGSDDLFLWLLMFELKRKFVVYPECLYIHTYTGDNLSQSSERMAASSLSFIECLYRIPYVSKRHIEILRKSRNFDLNWLAASKFRKVRLLMNNIDIVIHRMWWKLKCM